SEINNQMYEFEGYQLDHKLISQLEKDPSTFLVGAEPPFLCGTNWPDSGISEVVEINNVPLDSLMITDGKNVIATIHHDEIPMLINWFKDLTKSEEHTSELQSRFDLVCRLLLEKKNTKYVKEYVRSNV